MTYTTWVFVILSVLLLLYSLFISRAFVGLTQMHEMRNEEIKRLNYLIDYSRKLSQIDAMRLFMMNTTAPGHWNILEDRDDENKKYALFAFKHCKDARHFENIKINLEGVLEDSVRMH